MTLNLVMTRHETQIININRGIPLKPTNKKVLEQSLGFI